VFVDSATDPRNVVVIAQGDPSTRTVDQVYLFGAPTSEALQILAQAIRGPMEIVCDEDVARLVAEHQPNARKRDWLVAWYARLEDADHVRAEPGARRLRIAEAEHLAPLLPGWALRTFRNPKDLVTGGTVYVVESEGRIASAGFSIDQSAKYERIGVSTWEALRGKGLGTKAAVKVCRAVADQGRIPCAIVDCEDVAGLRLAQTLGFTERALMTTWTTAFRM
jgi:RimJ/RimL family protein N-acetyltransferase